MLQIYWAKTSKTRVNKSLQDLLIDMPNDIQERALRYKLEAPAYDFAIGRLLLKKGLADFGLRNQFENIQYTEKGKPFIKDLHFNIAHTAGLVVCAFSENSPIGIDIEKIRAINLVDFTSFFTESEWKEIYSNENPINAFFKFWVRKESIIKTFGITLKALNEIDTSLKVKSLIFKGRELFFKPLNFGEGYFGEICSGMLIGDTCKVEIELGK